MPRERIGSDDFFDAVEGPDAAGPASPERGCSAPAAGITGSAPRPARKYRTHKLSEGYGGMQTVHTFCLPERYTRPSLLSEGAYGIVISAVDTLDNNTPVAIKRISEPWGVKGVARQKGKDHPDAIRHAKLAFREIRILRFLKESWKDSCVKSGVPEDDVFGNQQFNLVGMRDCFLTEPEAQQGKVPGALDIYIVLEHFGEDADKFCKKNVLDLDTVRELAFQMLQAMQYLHSAGVIHRDLKPANLAIRRVPPGAEGGDPACDLGILDFGLARSVTADNAQYTDFDAVTREYRAPEVHFKKGEFREYDAAIDMWAFGIILAELLSSCAGSNAQWSMFQSRASDNYLNVFSKIVQAVGVPPSEFTQSLDAVTQQFLHDTFGASPTQTLRDFLRQPLAKVPFFASKEGESDMEQAIDLIDRILKYDPKERLTAEKALEHPFFAAYHPGGDLDPGVWGKIVSSSNLDTTFEDWDLDADGWKERVLAEVDEFLRMWPPPRSETGFDGAAAPPRE